MGQEDSEFKASLSNLARLCLKAKFPKGGVNGSSVEMPHPAHARPWVLVPPLQAQSIDKPKTIFLARYLSKRELEKQESCKDGTFLLKLKLEVWGDDLAGKKKKNTWCASLKN